MHQGREPDNRRAEVQTPASIRKVSIRQQTPTTNLELDTAPLGLALFHYIRDASIAELPFHSSTYQPSNRRCSPSVQFKQRLR